MIFFSITENRKKEKEKRKKLLTNLEACDNMFKR